jgi:hypothetical protein
LIAGRFLEAAFLFLLISPQFGAVATKLLKKTVRWPMKA